MSNIQVPSAESPSAESPSADPSVGTSIVAKPPIQGLLTKGLDKIDKVHEAAISFTKKIKQHERAFTDGERDHITDIKDVSDTAEKGANFGRNILNKVPIPNISFFGGTKKSRKSKKSKKSKKSRKSKKSKKSKKSRKSIRS
jgi:hypothetical protein